MIVTLARAAAAALVFWVKALTAQRALILVAAVADLAALLAVHQPDRLAAAVLAKFMEAAAGAAAKVLRVQMGHGAQFASFGLARLGYSLLQTPATCSSRCLVHGFLSGTINRTGPMTRFS